MLDRDFEDFIDLKFNNLLLIEQATEEGRIKSGLGRYKSQYDRKKELIKKAKDNIKLFFDSMPQSSCFNPSKIDINNIDSISLDEQGSSGYTVKITNKDGIVFYIKTLHQNQDEKEINYFRCLKNMAHMGFHVAGTEGMLIENQINNSRMIVTRAVGNTEKKEIFTNPSELNFNNKLYNILVSNGLFNDAEYGTEGSHNVTMMHSKNSIDRAKGGIYDIEFSDALIEGLDEGLKQNIAEEIKIYFESNTKELAKIIVLGNFIDGDNFNDPETLTGFKDIMNIAKQCYAELHGIDIPDNKDLSDPVFMIQLKNVALNEWNYQRNMENHFHDKGKIKYTSRTTKPVLSNNNEIEKSLNRNNLRILDRVTMFSPKLQSIASSF